MPDPRVYLKVMGAAGAVSALFVLAIAGRRPANTTRLNAACLLSIGFGLAAGFQTMSLPSAWPPANGLDRFVTIIIPALLGIESIAAFPRVPRRAAWFLRIGLAAVIPRILLHGSTYLSGTDDDWDLRQVHMAQAVGSALLAGVWILLVWLSERSPGVSIPFGICLTIQCAGLAVMLAGYIKGGAAAFPLVATLATTAIGVKLISKWSGAPANFDVPATLGIGVVGLFSILFIGRFFGRLSTGCALTILLTPLVCWVTELPQLRHRSPWLVGLVRLVLVAIPLTVVLAAAKRDFDRKMAPLLGMATGNGPRIYDCCSQCRQDLGRTTNHHHLWIPERATVRSCSAQSLDEIGDIAS